MTKHVIIGAGNLGASLAISLSDKNPSMYDRKILEIFPQFLRHLRQDPPDFLWWCIGGGYKRNLDEELSRRLSVEMPLELLDQVSPSTSLAFFSSADCVDSSYPEDPRKRNNSPARTVFAKYKGQLEGIIMSRRRPRTAVVRVSEIYGTHRPLDTFPGRLLSTAWPDQPLIFPSNEITPTPSDWLAEVLVKCLSEGLFSEEGETFHHAAPWGSVSTLQWAKMIFDSTKPNKARVSFIERVCWNDKRPRASALGCSLPLKVDHWSTLWLKHFRREDYQKP